MQWFPQQIIDLWMGRAASLDGALQLLLIVDLICEWARDVFRFDISCCLAGGRDNLRRDNLRHASPAPTYASRFSTQEPQHEGTTNNSTHGAARSSPLLETDIDDVDFTDTASMTSLTLEESMMEVDGMMNDYPEVDQDESIESYGDVVSHPLLKWATISPTDIPWSGCATIRHSNMCLFAFSHLSLPTDLESLVACLRQASSSEVGSPRTIAMSLLVSLTDQSLVKNTTMDHILQLKGDWLRKSEATLDGSEYPLRALFVFRTYIRTSDWQIVRELRCISCTAQTVQNLAKIAGFSVVSLRIRMQQSAKEHPLPASDFEALRGLTGRIAASAAIKSKVLYHRVAVPGGDPGIFGCPWESHLVSQDMEKSCSVFTPSLRYRERTASYLDRGTALMEVLKKPLPADLWYHLEPDTPAKRGAILLHKGKHWPQTTPSWCLMILDELELERSEELAMRVWTQKAYGAFDFAPRPDEAGKPLRAAMSCSGDEDFLAKWIVDLQR